MAPRISLALALHNHQPVGNFGWVFGDVYDTAYRPMLDALDLYRILEDEVVPRYYERTAAGLPREWLALMKRAMTTSIWRFSTTRMLHEYAELLYLPAAGVDPAVTTRKRRVVTEAG